LNYSQFSENRYKMEFGMYGIFSVGQTSHATDLWICELLRTTHTPGKRWVILG
jgi:hypothetical protein